MNREREALRALLGFTDKKRSGDMDKRRKVAEMAGVSPDYLYQIAAGIKLRSGKVRTVGRELRERLDGAYPGWLDSTPMMPGMHLSAVSQPDSRVLPQPLSVLLRELGAHLAGVDHALRPELADLMSAWVKSAGKASYETLVADCIAGAAMPPGKRQTAGQ